MSIRTRDLPEHVAARIAREAAKSAAVKPKARARAKPTPGTMNKLEAQYADHLAAMLATGEIQWWAFEPMKLRLADRTFYTPDFGVVTRDGFIECHETKGFWEDDARVKIKVAAETYWWLTFRGIKKLAAKHGGGWEIETFSKEQA